jgi:kynureninase
VVITDTTSVNLFKALAAALQMQATDPARAARRIIVSERSNFPTDLYMAQGLAAWLDRGYQLRLVDSPEALAQAIDADCAVAMLTHVNYRTGYQHDMAAISATATRRARWRSGTWPIRPAPCRWT